MPKDDAYHYGTFILAVIKEVEEYRKNEEVMQRLTAIVPAFIKGHLDSYERTNIKHLPGQNAGRRHPGAVTEVPPEDPPLTDAPGTPVVIYNFSERKNRLK